jgi:glycosyltransferase involved in cell wall biosynthesis
LLLQLINNLDPAFEAEFFSLYKGELYDELDPKVRKDYLLKDQKRGTFFQKLRAKFAFGVRLPAKLRSRKGNTWYINTIVLPGILSYAKKNEVKCILHCHELEPFFSILNESQKLLTIQYPSLVIANSKASSATFAKNSRRAALEISYPFIDVNSYKFDLVSAGEIRKKLAFKVNDFVWLMCGTFDKNKNPELFIALARKFSKDALPCKFVWIGSSDRPEYMQQIITAASDLKNITWITDRSSTFKSILNGCNGILLTSQLESFSLVTLEALAAGKPVVANNCIGVNEIIVQGTGIIVEKKNSVDDFVQAMVKTMNDAKNFDPAIGVKRATEFDRVPGIQKWNSILKDHLT